MMRRSGVDLNWNGATWIIYLMRTETCRSCVQDPFLVFVTSAQAHKYEANQHQEDRRDWWAFLRMMTRSVWQGCHLGLCLSLGLLPLSEECRGRRCFVCARAVTWIEVKNLHYLANTHTNYFSCLLGLTKLLVDFNLSHKTESHTHVLVSWCHTLWGQYKWIPFISYKLTLNLCHPLKFLSLLSSHNSAIWRWLLSKSPLVAHWAEFLLVFFLLLQDVYSP